MTADEYNAALETLGLTQIAAGRWLLVADRTAQNYAAKGPVGPARRAITMLLDMSPDQRAAALARVLD